VNVPPSAAPIVRNGYDASCPRDTDDDNTDDDNHSRFLRDLDWGFDLALD